MCVPDNPLDTLCSPFRNVMSGSSSWRRCLRRLLSAEKSAAFFEPPFLIQHCRFLETAADLLFSASQVLTQELSLSLRARFFLGVRRWSCIVRVFSDLWVECFGPFLERSYHTTKSCAQEGSQQGSRLVGAEREIDGKMHHATSAMWDEFPDVLHVAQGSSEIGGVDASMFGVENHATGEGSLQIRKPDEQIRIQSSSRIFSHGHLQAPREKLRIALDIRYQVEKLPGGIRQELVLLVLWHAQFFLFAARRCSLAFFSCAKSSPAW